MKKFALAAATAWFMTQGVALAADKAPTPAAAATKKAETKKDEPKKVEPKAAKGKDAAKNKDSAKAPTGTIVELKTTEGVIKIELADKDAPVTVKNFIAYVNDKFYDGTIFHRVIDGFMVQGGGFTADGDKLNEKPTKAAIINEAKNGLKNDRGTVAMARTNDPNSATAQFFINHVNNDRLNSPQPDGFGYAVFGKVIEGMDVVDKIAKVKTGMRGGMGDVPMTDVKILTASVAKPAG